LLDCVETYMYVHVRNDDEVHLTHLNPSLITELLPFVCYLSNAELLPFVEFYFTCLLV